MSTDSPPRDNLVSFLLLFINQRFIRFILFLLFINRRLIRLTLFLLFFSVFFKALWLLFNFPSSGPGSHLFKSRRRRVKASNDERSLMIFGIGNAGYPGQCTCQ